MRLLAAQRALVKSWSPTPIPVTTDCVPAASVSAPADFAASVGSRMPVHEGGLASLGDEDEEGALPDEEESDGGGMAEETEQEETCGDANEVDVNDEALSVTMGVEGAVEVEAMSGVSSGVAGRSGFRHSGRPRRDVAAPDGGDEVGPDTRSRRGALTDGICFREFLGNLQCPNMEDSYYIAALRNAYNTLTEYAEFIGVNGRDFLKHLFSYYIVGAHATTEFRRRLSHVASALSGDPALSMPGRSTRKHGALAYNDLNPSYKRRRLRCRGDINAPTTGLQLEDPVPSTLAVDLALPTTLNSVTPSPSTRGSPTQMPKETSPSSSSASPPMSTQRRPVPSSDGFKALIRNDIDYLSDITENESSAKSNLSDLSSSSSDERNVDDGEARVALPKKFHKEQLVSSAVLSPNRGILDNPFRLQLQERLKCKKAYLQRLYRMHTACRHPVEIKRMQFLIEKLTQQIDTLLSVCEMKRIAVRDLLDRYS